MTVSSTSTHKLWHLTHLAILSECALQDLEYLSGICHLDTIPKGSVIYLPGDPADTVYFLKQGRVKVSRLSEDGKQMTLLVLEQGTLFGEMAILDPIHHHENIAEAMEDVLLCHTPKSHFEDFLGRHPKLSLQIAKLMGSRLKQIENRLEDILFLSVEARLSKLLQQLAQEYGQPVSEGVRITIKLTHQELGQLIHATRQTVTELLNQFQSAGLLHTEQRYLILHPVFLKSSTYSPYSVSSARHQAG